MSMAAQSQVIGYSPDGGYLIRGRRRDSQGQWVEPFGPEDVAEVGMANVLDQRVFGATPQDAVVVVLPKRCWDGDVKRYLARRTSFVPVSAEATGHE
jgi:hypothetical protein